VWENAHVANNIYADNGLNVGPGGIKSDGPVSITDVLRLTPRSSAPSPASEGDMYMNSDDHTLYVYDGTSWQACW